MDFLEELRWRGMLNDYTPGVEELLQKGGVVGYIGFDPTAPSLTIGNYVQIMLLSLWQRCGHRPVMLMGGATGRIGDPSGKDQERQLKSYAELDANLDRQVKQAEKLLDFKGENAAMLVNNLEFYRDMNVLEFLRNVGKTLTVNYMMSKDSVKNRLDSGLSFTEFSYQLLQAYDFQCLYEQYDCQVQMGGSDQWGNITSGTEFIRRNVEGKAYAITTPLLTKADGSKFGKSEQGNIWLDPEMTTPYDFYQFWVNADDADLPKFLRYFSFRSKEEVESLEEEYAGNPNALKRILAEELTVRVHSREDYESVRRVSELLFGRGTTKADLLELREASYRKIAEEIPHFTLAKAKLKTQELSLIDLLAEHTSIVGSKSEARRAIKGNAVSVNREKVSDEAAVVTSEDLILDKYLLVENGKKNKFLIEAV